MGVSEWAGYGYGCPVVCSSARVIDRELPSLTHSLTHSPLRSLPFPPSAAAATELIPDALKDLSPSLTGHIVTVSVACMVGLQVRARIHYPT